jgi:polysaccharide export outer membrane protein
VVNGLQKSRLAEWLRGCVRRVSRKAPVICGLAAAAFMSGCSAIPSSGPTKMEVFGQDSTLPGQFTIVDLTSSVASILQTRALPTFKGAFGDYRPAPDQRIGTGDSLAVTIWEAAAGGLFSAPAIDRASPGSRSAVIPEQVVTRDGSITVPYAGRIRVSGLRTQDVERAIVSRLEGKAIQPQALVTITRNASNTVTVTGEVTTGAVVPLNVRGQRIMEVIAMAGGVRGAAHDTFVVMTRSGRSVQVPLQRILASPSENIFARPGDVITLVRAPLSYTAVGATGANAVVPFGQVTLTLEEAIGKAGGLQDWRADPEGVFVMRYEPVALVRKMLNDPQSLPGRSGLTPVVYRINMRETNALFLARTFQILDKDILYVANAPLNEVQKIFSLINTLTSPALSVRSATR